MHKSFWTRVEFFISHESKERNLQALDVFRSLFVLKDSSFVCNVSDACDEFDGHLLVELVHYVHRFCQVCEGWLWFRFSITENGKPNYDGTMNAIVWKSYTV